MTQDRPAYALTADEQRVIPWLAAELSFSAIGDRVGMSGHAVRASAITLYRKLHVVTRREAVAACLSLGLLPETPQDQCSSVEDLDESFFQMKALRNVRGQIVDFQYEYCNRAALAVLGRRRDEVVGRHLLELFPSHLTDGLFAAYVQVVETGQPLRYEFSFDEGGVTGEFEVIVSRHGDGYVLAGHDIGARKRRERDLALVKDQLQRALTSRVIIEQAKGYTAARFRTDPETAFAALRRHARNNNQRLADLAESVVAGEVEVDLPMQGTG